LALQECECQKSGQFQQQMGEAKPPEHSQDAIDKDVHLGGADLQSQSASGQGDEPGPFLLVSRVAPSSGAQQGFKIVEDAGILVHGPLHDHAGQKAKIEK